MRREDYPRQKGGLPDHERLRVRTGALICTGAVRANGMSAPGRDGYPRRAAFALRSFDGAEAFRFLRAVFDREQVGTAIPVR